MYNFSVFFAVTASNIIKITRMLSNRMRTGRFNCRLGGRGCLSARGGGVCPGGVHKNITLPQTLFAGGNYEPAVLL